MSDIDPNKSDAQYTPRQSAQRWQRELELAGKGALEKWHKAGQRIVKAYLDQRDGTAQTDDGTFKLNLFWSNVQVLKSTLYARPPKVDVSRAHKDYNDDVARVTGIILERMLNSGLEDDYSDFDAAARQGIEDYLIVGLGQLWYRYEVQTQTMQTAPVIDPATGEELVPATTYEQITSESAATDYVYWQDFLWSPARTWEEITWVARRVYMTREQLVTRFGKKIGEAVPITQDKAKSSQNANDSNQPKREGRAAVWEIWDRTTKKAYWYVKGMDTTLDEKEDPLQLRNFFPCPKPLVSNLTTSNFVPRADYQMAQDQYNQIDEMTTRIAWLTRACKVVGVYDKTATGVSRMFAEGLENQLIPVDQWAAFAEKGGIKGAVDWVPVDQVAAVIERLTSQREILTQKLYEVLGIGDIMRGMTNPDETATAQQIKAQFGSTRLQFKQYEIGAWVAEAQRIKGEIIARHFQPDTIKRDSAIEHTPDGQFADQAIALLKSPDARYRITVESDSMATLDWAAERDARTQFMQAVGSYVQSITPMVQMAPQALPALIEMLKWGLGGFRVSKEIEGVLDRAIALAAQPQPPQPPDPKTQAEISEKQASAKRQSATAVKDLAQAGKYASETRMNAISNEIADPTGMGALPLAPPEPPPGAAPPMGPMQ